MLNYFQIILKLLSFNFCKEYHDHDHEWWKVLDRKRSREILIWWNEAKLSILISTAPISFEAWQWSVIRRVRGIVVNVRSLIPSGEVLNFSDKNPKVKMHFMKHKIQKQIKISKHNVTTNTNDCPLNWKQFAASQTLIQSIASVAFHHLPGSDFHNWQFSEYGKLGTRRRIW